MCIAPVPIYQPHAASRQIHLLIITLQRSVRVCNQFSGRHCTRPTCSVKISQHILIISLCHHLRMHTQCRLTNTFYVERMGTLFAKNYTTENELHRKMYCIRYFLGCPMFVLHA